MKATQRKNKTNFNENTTLWDEFVNHLETIYFPGASELLDTQLIAFEYESFKQMYSA